MKKNIAIVIILLTGNLLAQINIDSVLSKINYLPQDTVNISELVRQQIEQARLKAELSQIMDEHVPAKEEKVIDVKNSAATIPAASLNTVSNNKLVDAFNSLSTNVKIFLAASLLIVITVMYRRILVKIKKSFSSKLKKRIAMIREENVIVKKDKKLSKTRKALRKIKVLDHVQNDGLDLIARELSISKGEVLLASRIKKFEYGK